VLSTSRFYGKNPSVSWSLGSSFLLSGCYRCDSIFIKDKKILKTHLKLSRPIHKSIWSCGGWRCYTVIAGEPAVDMDIETQDTHIHKDSIDSIFTIPCQDISLISSSHYSRDVLLIQPLITITLQIHCLVVSLFSLFTNLICSWEIVLV
jgi:hypothetical protein